MEEKLKLLISLLKKGNFKKAGFTTNDFYVVKIFKYELNLQGSPTHENKTKLQLLSSLENEPIFEDGKKIELNYFVNRQSITITLL